MTKFENVRDTVYTFASEQALKKFLLDTLELDGIFIDENDFWVSGGRWNIRSKTIREIKRRTE